MIFKFLRYSLFVSLLIFSCFVKAQISHGGQPLFKNGTSKSVPKMVELPLYKTISLFQAASSKDKGSRLKNAQYAYKYKLNYTIDSDGIWEDLIDGRRVWRFAIYSKGAYSLGLEFSRFKLPVGSQLFVYNNNSDAVLGAYTAENNKKSGKFSVEPLEGDQLILEYIEPATVEFPAEIAISGVLHDYKNIFNLLKGEDSSVKSSGPCNVDINCPEGDDWQREKRSVCHILYDGWIASGALINNTNQDSKAYLLTAYHVINDQESAEMAVFYFNYENSNCGGSDGEKTQSISGSDLLATGTALDFTLLELSVQPPASYLPYYAGWDRSGRVPAYTTCIHHPSGDAKKISIDYDSPITSTYADTKYTFDENTHWQIEEWDVGTTEGGSSGSPLFDENHLIIGDLTGGDAYCGNSVNDYYAKFSESWDNYSSNNQQLKYWLDPINSGVEVLNGYDPNGGVFANFTTSSDTICYTSTVNFTDLSSGEPDTYIWDFGEDASPATSSDKGPHSVSYSSSGEKIITLKIGKGQVVDFMSKTIEVMDFPVADFDYKLEKKEVSFSNFSVDALGYQWSFGDGNSSNDVNPVHIYDSQNIYTVNLSVENKCGDNSISKQIYLSYNDQLKIYPNPSSGKYTVDLSKILFSQIIWEVYSSKGEQVRNGLISHFSSTLEFDLSGLSVGVYILKLNVDEDILERKLLLVK
ncbi:PKD domain-containing protein [Marinifilum sp. RC60d5]|uniref:PKD domain-containing protein n=1 Tax=Marinifilum sp. RC60d5 TaxID=3458414 RepID=UPI0040353407